MSRKKKNPYAIPATLGDIEKLKKQMAVEATKYVFAIVFTVLADKENMSPDDMKRIYDEANDLSDSINKGYVKLSDLLDTMQTEYGILIKE